MEPKLIPKVHLSSFLKSSENLVKTGCRGPPLIKQKRTNLLLSKNMFRNLWFYRSETELLEGEGTICWIVWGSFFSVVFGPRLLRFLLKWSKLFKTTYKIYGFRVFGQHKPSWTNCFLNRNVTRFDLEKTHAFKFHFQKPSPRLDANLIFRSSGSETWDMYI